MSNSPWIKMWVPIMPITGLFAGAVFVLIFGSILNSTSKLMGGSGNIEDTRTTIAWSYVTYLPILILYLLQVAGILPFIYVSVK